MSNNDFDITKIPIKDLLRYNLIDTLSTWYVFNKYYPRMIEDEQLEIYNDIFLPSIKTIVHMQLIGMPMDYEQVLKTNSILEDINNRWIKELQKIEPVRKYNWELQKKAFKKKNSELKKKFIPIEEFKTELNVNSGQQLQGLLYDYLGLPVINLTEKGQPSTDKETLETLYNQLITKYEITEEELEC